MRNLIRIGIGFVAAVVIACGAPDPASAAAPCVDFAASPWCNTSLSADARAALLLAELTQDEKFQLMGGDDPTGVFQLEPGEQHIGTSLGIDRVGIPTMFYTDGPVGVRQGSATAMPAPIGLAATFDPILARRFGAVIANESLAKRNDALHAPTTNIMRTPLAGRTFEGFGEDPFLASRITVDWIEGAEAEGVIANVKHFAANNQEVNRFTVNAVIDERTLREIYLPHFEAAVREAGVGTVMCSYNRLNGQKACENPHLLRDILQDDWGFEGYVLSDYGFAMISTAGSANGGTSLELPLAGWYMPTSLTVAVLAGQVSMATIDDHVRRILRTMFAYGLFDRPPLTNDDSLIDQPAHAAVAREVEEGAIVLLKNAPAPGGSPLLPLDASQLTSIAIIGRDADQFLTGGGSGAVTPFQFVTPRQGIEQRAGAGVQVSFNAGQTPQDGAAAASGADVAIVFASDHQMEFVDKPCLSLQCGNPDHGDQDGLIAAVAAANANTIVVLETGGPVLMPWVEQVPAVLEAWYPGQEGGTAIASVLFGDVDPGGRLSATFPRNENDKPANSPEQYPGIAEEALYSEGVFVGYRHYDENGIEPLFPFGHGLSYTTFAYTGFAIDTSGPEPVVTITVTNTGSRAGSEVVQLYLGLPDTAVPQPPKALKGFRKVTLDPAGTATVSFTLSDRALSYWDAGSSSWQVAPGCYQVMVGGSSQDVRASGSFPRSLGNSCGVCPMVGCRRPVLPAKSTLVLNDKPGQVADRLLWRWTKGAATTKADFGNPLATTDYRLCVYDGSAALATSASAPADGLCNGRSCWKETRRGFKYRKRDLTGAGLRNSLQIVLKEGPAGKAKIGVKGKGGVNPVVPPLPIAQPVTVQLVNGAGMCWEATYGAPAVTNQPGRFKDKSD